MIKAKVMIVEDEIISAMAMRQELLQIGYDVCELVSSGADALKIADREKPDVVLMDVGLRGEVDGVEAAQQIQTRFGIPVIFLTGYPEEEVREIAKAAGHCAYFIKPVQTDIIEETIEGVLKKRDMAGG